MNFFRGQKVNIVDVWEGTREAIVLSFNSVMQTVTCLLIGFEYNPNDTHTFSYDNIKEYNEYVENRTIEVKLKGLINSVTTDEYHIITINDLSRWFNSVIPVIHEVSKKMDFDIVFPRINIELLYKTEDLLTYLHTLIKDEIKREG